jgi:phosphatidylglycerophosphate synthase
MITAKQVADLFTFGRLAIAAIIAYVGFLCGKEGLPLVAMLLLLSWMSDSVDGPLARRSRVQYQTWIGDHDLEVDMVVAGGLLAYLVQAGFVALWAGISYTVLWAGILWAGRSNRSLGMLFQGPVYGYFLWKALLLAFVSGVLLLVWIAAAIIITWPKFPGEIVPRFIAGIETLGKRKRLRDK